MQGKSFYGSLIWTVCFVASGIAQSQQSRTLIVDGHPGHVAVIEANGKSCVEIEALANLTNGSLSFNGNQITLTLHAAPVGQPLQGVQRILDNVVAWRTGELRNKPSPTGIVVRVAPVGVLAPTSLSPLVAQRHISLCFSCAHLVQLRFFICQNTFLAREVCLTRNTA